MDTKKPEPSMDDGATVRVPERPSCGISPPRRRLIKMGAFVPPVVLTLRSGAALAQASAATCLAANQSESKRIASANDNFAVTDNPDGWARTDVVIKEARRVRRRKGAWVFKGNRVAKLYTHPKRNGNGNWISLHPGRSGRKWRLQDTGRTIEVRDPATGMVIVAGTLMRSAGNPRRRYVGIAETGALGLLQFDENGEMILNEDGDPEISDTLQSEDTQAPGGAITASCWASLNPTANI